MVQPPRKRSRARACQLREVRASLSLCFGQLGFASGVCLALVGRAQHEGRAALADFFQHEEPTVDALVVGDAVVLVLAERFRALIGNLIS